MGAHCRKPVFAIARSPHRFRPPFHNAVSPRHFGARLGRLGCGPRAYQPTPLATAAGGRLACRIVESSQQILGPAVLLLLMVVVGLQLTPADFRRVLSAPRAVVACAFRRIGIRHDRPSTKPWRLIDKLSKTCKKLSSYLKKGHVYRSQ